MDIYLLSLDFKQKIFRKIYTSLMSKFRAYKFKIIQIDDDDLKNIYNNIYYDYLLVCKKPDNTLQGLIRFPIQKTTRTVSNYFSKKAEIEPSTQTDASYKNGFMQDSNIIFEKERITKPKKTCSNEVR